MLVMISRKAEWIKLDDDVLQGKDMIETVPRKLRNTMTNYEEPTA
jgi:hypothetical protein